MCSYAKIGGDIIREEYSNIFFVHPPHPCSRPPSAPAEKEKSCFYFLQYFSNCHLVKDIFHPLLGQSGALNVSDSSELTSKPLALFSADWLLLFLL